MRNALVLGSEILGLHGVHNDVTQVCQALGARDFDVDCRIGQDATREGILAGYRDLIAKCGPDDAAVVYYSGHGARATPGTSQHKRRFFQCIVPTDWTAGPGFRGILDVELSQLLSQLTQKTPNVTVILDCCHSARMSRDSERTNLVPRSVPRAWIDGVEDFLAAQQLDLAGVHAESNPFAVKVEAAEVDRSAYEAEVFIDGKSLQMGLMTHALLQALDEIGESPLTWRTIERRVREFVMRQHPEQRPQVVGPADRLLFTTTTVDRPDGVVFFYDRTRPSLRAGKLQGARVGSVYEIMPPTVSDREPDLIVAMATVTAIEGSVARIKLGPPNGEFRSGALAFPREVPFPKALVGLRGETPGLTAIRTALEDHAFATVATDGSVQLEVIAEDGRLTLLDVDGSAIATPQLDDEDGQAFVLARLTRWGKALRLRDLQDGGLPQGITRIEWGRVENGEPIVMTGGESYHVGDRPFVRITNIQKTPVYVAIFDVGVSGNVSLLSGAEPWGYKLTPDDNPTYTLGESFGQVIGLPEMHWPDDVPRVGALPESFIVVIAEDRQDFTAFETQRAARGRITTLESILDSIRDGSTRDSSNMGTEGGGRYGVGRIDFDFGPSPRTNFVVDLSVAPRSLAWASQTARGELLETPSAAPPSRVAIRLNEVAIHDNRTLWGRTTVRFDTLVLTQPSEGEPPFAAATRRFDRIADGDRLPFDDMLLYEGGVQCYLELAMWVSREEHPQDDLSRLLVDATKDPELQAAVATLLSVAVPPHAAAFVALGTAAAYMLHAAETLLQKALGNRIGLYRRSFLASEQFGLGRHPATGLTRSQDFSFRFTIET